MASLLDFNIKAMRDLAADARTWNEPALIDTLLETMAELAEAMSSVADWTMFLSEQRAELVPLSETKATHAGEIADAIIELLVRSAQYLTLGSVYVDNQNKKAGNG